MTVYLPKRASHDDYSRYAVRKRVELFKIRAKNVIQMGIFHYISPKFSKSGQYNAIFI